MIVTPASSAGQALSDSEGSKILASIPSLQYSDQVLTEGFWILRLRLRMTYSNNRKTLGRVMPILRTKELPLSC